MELRRILLYPVKSMAAQEVQGWTIEQRGLVGDRRWALRDGDGKLGSGKDSRRFRRYDALFGWSARLTGPLPGGVPEVVCGPPDSPSGWLPADDATVTDELRRATGADVRLAEEADIPHFDDAPISLVGSATLADLGARAPGGHPVDPRQLRANLVVETTEPYAEDAWVGTEIELGSVVLQVTHRIERCRMVDIAQAGLPARWGVLKATGERDACVGVYARVERPGDVRVQDSDRL